MPKRDKHPDKTIDEALSYAENSGWRIEKSGKSSHAWGKMYCPVNDSECRNGIYCIQSIYSTPRVPENHANMIKKIVDRCIHQKRGKSE